MSMDDGTFSPLSATAKSNESDEQHQQHTQHEYEQPHPQQPQAETSTSPASIISPSLNGTATASSTSPVKPRVSFNRDVHVKRIGSRGASDTVPALTGVGPGLGGSVSNNNETSSGVTRLLALPVRRENLGHLSREELAEEAAKVLKQADSVHCVSNRTGSFPEKFYSLPTRKKNRIPIDGSPNSSQIRRRRSEELGVTTPTVILETPPKKPPRTFLSRTTTTTDSDAHTTPVRPKRTKRNSFKNLFKRTKKVKRSKSDASRKSDKPNITTKLNRSRSDTSDRTSKYRDTNVRKRPGISNDDINITTNKKSQLSPIIEVSPNVEQSPKPDYFSAKTTSDLNSSDKENSIEKNSNKISDLTTTNNPTNIELKPPERKKWKKHNQVYVIKQETEREEKVEETREKFIKVERDESSETENFKPNGKSNTPSFVIIDVDSAENITSRKNPLRKSFEDKIRSFTRRKGKQKDVDTTDSVNHIEILKNKFEEEIRAQSAQKVENMLHNSQKSTDRLLMNRSSKVDHMVKRLTSERFSPPPKNKNVLIAPTVGIQHNNNQPFSYTKPSISPNSDLEYTPRNSLSPERDYDYHRKEFRSSELFHTDRKYDRPISPINYTKTYSPSYGDYPRARSPYRSVSPTVGTTYEDSSMTKPNGEPGKIIYAQVVCGSDSNDAKQTVHRTYEQRKIPTQNSDSDEGLGYEEFGKNRLEAKDSFNDDLPITPKYQAHAFTKKEYSSNFVDTSVLRGRADGMDSKRRESLTEYLNDSPKLNELNDLSSRRELLESRINSRNKLLQSYTSSTPQPKKQYITEKSSRYMHREGSSSPVGFIEKYTSESYLDKNGEMVTNESRFKELYGDRYNTNTNNRITDNGYNSTPAKNFHKSNPELIAQKRYEDVLERRNNRYEQTNYKSYHDSLKRDKSDQLRQNDPLRTKDKFVDSGIENDFRRDHSDRRMQHITTTTPTNQRHSPRNDSEDEGFQSSLLIAVEKQHAEDTHERKIKTYHTEYLRKERRDYEYNENERRRTIEASDRNHYNHAKDYDDSDHEYRTRNHRKGSDESDRELLKYKEKSDKKKQPEYVPRERSIDDGSHYDPRIDKDLDKNKKMDSKPPKPEKKMSSLEKVKSLFTSKKTKEKRAAAAAAKSESQLMVDEEEVRARYTEYKGSKEDLDMKQEVDYSKRKKLTTPRSSRSPTPDHNKEPLSSLSSSRNNKSAQLSSTNTLLRKNKQQQREHTQQRETNTSNTNNNWFKSIDRLTRKNKKSNLVNQSDISKISETEVSDQDYPPNKPQKNLRFFGDTDIESNNDSIRHTPLKSRSTLQSINKTNRNLNDIDEQSDLEIKKKETSKVSGKPPVSPYDPRNARGHSQERDSRKKQNGNDTTLKRLRRNDSLAESSTEGDSSQQSQRSVVYLHAATVGDIPGPGNHSRLGRRVTSREELNSLSSSRIASPQVKTLSRSFSVLAPWRPRHYRESYDIDYSQQPTTTRSKLSTSTVKSKIESKNNSRNGSSTLNRRSKSKDNISTLNRKSHSRENISKSRDDITRNSSTLNRKTKESESGRKSKSRENISTLNRKIRDSDTNLYKKNEKSTSSHGSKKSMSLESLGGNNSNRRMNGSDRGHEKRDKVSRSVSMPKEKSAGWFGKKSSKK